MDDLRITHVGTYRHAQSGTMALRQHGLSLNVSGLRSYRTADIELFDPGACLMLSLARRTHTFEYGPDRENRVVLFTGQGLRRCARPDMLEWRDGDAWVGVPIMVPLDASDLVELRPEWDRMEALFRSPVPENLLLLKIAFLRMLGEMIVRHAGARVTSPVEELRRRIDRDDACDRSIADLSRACGYSADHLRELFRTAYGMSPREYRLRRRVMQANELILNSALTVKEMARRLGFRHVSHFSMLFRKHMGESPSEAIRRSRQTHGTAPRPPGAEEEPFPRIVVADHAQPRDIDPCDPCDPDPEPESARGRGRRA